MVELNNSLLNIKFLVRVDHFEERKRKGKLFYIFFKISLGTSSYKRTTAAGTELVACHPSTLG